MSYWGRIPETLRSKGIYAFLGNTDAWGRYDSNAEILKNTVDAVLRETRVKKVNIIAHSKGGLDARYFIWKYRYGGQVASLTTMSTPHRGSELADILFKQKTIHSALAKKILKVFGKLYGDADPDLYNVIHHLTTEEMQAFNETAGMDDRVYYQSVYTTMRGSWDDLMFFYSYWYIKSAAGENDGVVSEHSARWGNNIIKINGSISHAEILDYKKRKIAGIHIPDIYLKIADDLQRKGF